VIQPNGQIVVVGSAETLYAMPDFLVVGGPPPTAPPDTYADVVVRLNPDGTLDTSFGMGGTVVIPMTVSTTTGVDGVSLGANGTITVTDGSKTFVFDVNGNPLQNNNGGGVVTITEPIVPTPSTPPTAPIGPTPPANEGQAPQQLSEENGGATESLAQTGPIETDDVQQPSTAEFAPASIVQNEAAFIQPGVAGNAIAQSIPEMSSLVRPTAVGPYDSSRAWVAPGDDQMVDYLPPPDAEGQDLPAAKPDEQRDPQPG